MLRPCYLVIDREHSGSISTRKLVIETAKFNVITAYSGSEALEALSRFPNVDGIVLDAGMKYIPCSALIQELLRLRADLPIIVVGDRDRHPCIGGTQFIENFNPKQILALLQKNHPEQTAAIDDRNLQLESEEDSH